MSKIKNMISEQSSIWIEFPDIEGFEINRQVSYSRRFNENS